ncbi:GNAT family N-acetyltransferase [bacterium]|nr:GNAT family N-acetyltransferase [bacterium]
MVDSSQIETISSSTTFLPRTHRAAVAKLERPAAHEYNSLNPYEVRLAQPYELDEVFALRYDVFFSASDTQHANMRDVDAFDAHADHLIVKAEGRIVATYRMLPTDRLLNAGLSLYAASEFAIAPLMERINPSRTVELGRSCVHPAHRNGSIPKLLWSALAKYMMDQGRSDAVGCVSVFNCSHLEAAGILEYFKRTNVYSEDMRCLPLHSVDAEQCEQQHELNALVESGHCKSLVPPLLRSYLMLGAKILGGPAHDPAFNCHDFLMHFSTESMSERCKRSFFS